MLRTTLSMLWAVALLAVGNGIALAQQSHYQQEKITDRDGTVFVWQGIVGSHGDKTQTIPLNRDNRYYIEVSRSVYVGRWKENRNRSLVNDACYEFNATGRPTPIALFKNSLNISVCDGHYHSNHIYRSAAFSGNDRGIRFWIFDTDYRDNTGGLWVKVFQLKASSKKSQSSQCRCKDFQRIGEFSLVLNGQTIKRRLGFSECLNYAKTLRQCFTRHAAPAPKTTKARNLCACKDLHHAGVFSLMINNKVIKPGLGFSECLGYRKTLSQCHSR